VPQFTYLLLNEFDEWRVRVESERRVRGERRVREESERGE
jgi:hypothetical protein